MSEETKITNIEVTEITTNTITEIDPLVHEVSTEELTLAGMDSTAWGDLDVSVSENENDVEVKIDEFIEESKKRNFDREKLTNEGLALIQDGSKEMNILFHSASIAGAKWAILLGRMLLALKKVAVRPNESWEAWAEENLTFIHERNRQKYMKIGKRKDCHHLFCLGLERLYLLCSLTEDIEGEDTIKPILDEFEIKYDFESRDNIQQFKNAVDAAINREKLLKKGFDAEKELIMDLTIQKVKFDSSLFNKLRVANRSKGDPVVYLKEIRDNDGKVPVDEVEEDKGKKRLDDFTTLARKLSRTISYLTKDDEKITEIINARTHNRVDG